MEVEEVYKGLAMSRQDRETGKMGEILNTIYVQFYLFLSSFVCVSNRP